MTKFIFHGGATSKLTENNRKFYSEIVSDFPNSVKVLVVCFTLPEEHWGSKFEKTIKVFHNFVDTKIEFELASSVVDQFIKQVEASDVIFISGGNELLLGKYLKVVSNLEELLEDKVVVGSSAGANIFSKYYYTNDRSRIENGLGTLPIKTICHYDDSKKGKYDELVKYKEKLEIYAIEEEKFYILINLKK